ncbi:alpha-amylase 1-like [Eurosta solidaginis]|uniref:alpha-amylase 1-like n=1 Tax=Eurosta solidaginis TaxID=178769 RepID=UPI003530F63C
MNAKRQAVGSALGSAAKGAPAFEPLARVSYSLPTRYLAHALQMLLLLYLVSVARAIALDTNDGGSGRLQSEEPSQTLLDHTRTYFLPNRTGIVQLFEWKFVDIAKECEEFLGPHGYAGVQVSPVTEHLVAKSAGIENPWWERYQPLSFQIASRSGDEAEFVQMARACNTAGVRVYVDVVLNHVAGAYDEETASGQRLLEGYAGSTANASSLDFPAFPFTRNHFNTPCNMDNYMDGHVVRNCALNSWPDLNLSRLDVRSSLTDFLNRLVDLGVAGFRVDNAKYIWPIDIKLLFNGIKNLNSEEFDFPANARPFVYQNVVDIGVDSISKTEYSSYGLVTDYLYAAELANIINGKAPLSSLINWGPAMGFLQHQQALVFVDSHDGQRDAKLLGANRLLSYKQPRKYIMATAFMLAHPYGRVKRIMSSYYFTAQQPEQGPPMEERDAMEAEPKDDVEIVADGEVENDADGVGREETETGEAEEEEAEAGMAGTGGAEEEGAEAGDAEAGEAESGKAEVDEADADPNQAEEADAVANAEPEKPNAPTSKIRSPTFDAATGRCEHESGWVCEHRWPQIVNMIELVSMLDEMEDGVINFQTDGPNHIAFCRGEKAFFAFNNDAERTYDAEVVTCLPSGVYCDVISGGRAVNAEHATDCVGKRIVVNVEGKTQIMLPAVLAEAGAVAGSDYDEADVEANDAYSIALGDEGEFGVLAVYVGSRLVGDEDAKEAATEVVKEDDAEDAENITEVAAVTKEDVSTEELEGSADKNAKLEEAAHDASVEGSEGETAATDAEEADEESKAGEDGEDEEAVADEPAPAHEPEETEDKQKETAKGVEETLKEVVDGADVPPLESIGVGIKTIAEGIANNTNRVIAKAGFNDAPRMSQSIHLCSLPILISTILINFYSTYIDQFI